MTEPIIPDDAVAAFARDGVCCLRGLVDRRWQDIVAAGIERDLADPGPYVKVYTPPGGSGCYFGDLVMWRRIPEFEEFVLRGPAAAIAGRLMGAAKVTFYHDHLLVKEPRTPEHTPWHHDLPYFPIDGQQVCGLWLALDPVDRATAIEFVAGSHRWGRWFAPRYFADGTDYYDDADFDTVPDIDADRDRYRVLAWELEPGDCLAFHALTLHGSPGNLSQHRRRAYVTRWTGEDVVYAERPGLISPDIRDHGLKPGDPLGGEMFPLVWTLPQAAP